MRRRLDSGWHGSNAGQDPPISWPEKDIRMSYVDRNLIPGEKVSYKTGLHWSVLIGPFLLGALFAIGALLLSIYAYSDKGAASNTSGASVPSEIILTSVGILSILAAITIISGIVRRNSTEMAVTNKRVIVKTGILGRRTFELLLSQIESILVEENLIGRMLGFGTVIIRGTGSTLDPLRKIARPLEFRKQVQEHIEVYQQRSPASGSTPAPPH
jgi:uncharacterized membrane protein YdbT with pleckstrin-like domain